MTKILIVDDEPQIRAMIRKIIEEDLPSFEIVGEAKSVQEATHLIKELTPNLLLLDINLRDGTGFDILEQFPDPPFNFLFLTAYDEYALRALKLSALDYLLKPIDPDELIHSLKRTSQLIENQEMASQLKYLLLNFQQNITSIPSKIILNSANKIYVVEFKDIMYCEASRSYSCFYLINGEKILVTKNIGEYEEILPENVFFRPHKSFIINYDFIDYIDKKKNEIILKNKNTIVISELKKQQLLKKMKT